ncbi:MAG: hypothetical protein ACLPXT_12230 [Terracidiphilus sp.]
MLATMSDNTNSLSLALDARTAVKALNALQKGGEVREELERAMSDAVTSLNALSSGTPLFAHLSSTSSFENYDQIQTLQEVQKAFPDVDLAGKLALVTNANDPDQRQQGIMFAIAFFSALEKRALQKFNRSYGFGI